MAGSKKRYLEREILKWSAGQANDLGDANAPWLALFSTSPTNDSDGTELSGNGYARVNCSGKWGNPELVNEVSHIENNQTIEFSKAEGQDWSVDGWALYDDETGGNQLWFGELDEQITVPIGKKAQFRTGKLVLTDD